MPVTGSRDAAPAQAEVAAPAPVGRVANIRPRDASTLLVLRRDGDAVRVLMGRRSQRHVFHPGSVVFPGGSVSRHDSYGPSLDELSPAVAAKLGLRTRSPARARALALAAIRETAEEVGVLIGAPGSVAPRRAGAAQWEVFSRAGLVPTLAPLRFIARAITPPGRIRRFDARFFVVFAEAIGGQLPPPNEELIEASWLTFEEAERCALPYITRIVIDQLRDRLADDPALEAPAPVVFHYTRHGRRIQELI